MTGNCFDFLFLGDVLHKRRNRGAPTRGGVPLRLTKTATDGLAKTSVFECPSWI